MRKQFHEWDGAAEGGTIPQQTQPPGRKSCLGGKFFATLASGLLCAGAAHAGSAFFDFNSDPTTNGLLTLYGNGSWQPSGGVGAATNANDGYLVVTSAQGSQRSAIVFADIDHGEVVAAFTFEADFRIGNGTQNPADGFSVNYVRSNDPVLTDVAGGGDPAADGNIWATGPNCEGNLPEEGTQTGISVGFDVWDSGAPSGGAPACNVASGSGITRDIIGLDIRVDGTLVLQAPMTTQNGDVTDATSIQTGPYDGSNSFTNLAWAHLKVVMDTNQQLSVTWKGKLILSNYQTAYFPSAGALVFAGRTGGSWENQHVDNIQITTIGAPLALVGGATGSADGFSVLITDSGNSSVDTTKPITVTLDGTAIPSSALTITKTGPQTTIVYHGFPTLLASGSQHTLVVTAKDNNNNTVTGSPTFTIPSYSTLPGGDAVTGVDTTKSGFRMMPWQSGAEPNRVYWANEQLAGLHGANNANLSGATDGGFIDYTGVLNFNINAGNGDAGQFTTNNGWADTKFPGIPGANGLNGSTAEEILAFVQFKAAGVYEFGVDSDDGFAVTEGKNPRDRFALLLGEFDGGRGQGSPTYFTVAVTNAGIYPLRLIWENGNGELPDNGAGLEWFTRQADGSKILINDPSPTNTSGVAAFYAGPSLPAFTSQINPYPGQGGVRPDQVIAQLTDSGTAVNQNSVSLSVDGASTPAAVVSKAGSVTTAKISYPTSALLAPGNHTATLTWADNGTTPLTHSNSWSFSVMTYGVTLDSSLSVPNSALDKSQIGLSVQVSQADPSIVGSTSGLPNQSDSMNALLAGLYFPWWGTNTADVFGSTANNTQPYTNNFWFWTNAMDFNIVTSGGDFPLDYGLPGIPGVTGSSDNLAAAFDSWVVFPTAGFYILGVNSDDGFRLSEGQGVTRQVLHVTGPNGIDTDVGAVVSVTNWGNGGFGASLPFTPLTAPVFVVTSNNVPDGHVVNLTNKIAVVTRGFFGRNSGGNCYWAATNGAVAALLLNRPGDGFASVMTATPPAPPHIPCMNINGEFGQINFWLTNNNLTASIGADAHLIINSADYGKGMNHQDAGFIVPSAGAYPLHLLYYQGGGGAGLEFTVVNGGIAADGSRSLINDNTDSGSLLAYQPTAAKPISRPTLSVSNVGGKVTISFTGTLTSSSTVNGTYAPVPGATSPFTPTGSAPVQFYRSHQ